MTRVRLTPTISVPEQAVRLAFVRSSGPGGQNVNKVSTAVELRLDLDAAQLSAGVRARLERLVGSRLTQANEIVIFAQR
ncbi:MAG TPA: peptide chain release factor-like protein, partial [Pseudomonadales bacterium]|nr:peptide chain release factor-like protein [Pseudomonadales bacterium]